MLFRSSCNLFLASITRFSCWMISCSVIWVNWTKGWVRLPYKNGLPSICFLVELCPVIGRPLERWRAEQNEAAEASSERTLTIGSILAARLSFCSVYSSSLIGHWFPACEWTGTMARRPSRRLAQKICRGLSRRSRECWIWLNFFWNFNTR